MFSLCKYIIFYIFVDDTYDMANGEKLSTGQISIFIVGIGGFKGKRISTFTVSTVDPPSRNPDTTITQQTNVDQVRKKEYMC